MSQIHELLNRLDRVRPMGQNRWIACCPAHGDKHPSLNIKLTDDDTVLVVCRSGGCSAHEIVSAVGMNLTDLFPKTDRHHAPRQKYPFSAREVLAAMVPESFAIALIGKQMSQGIAPDEKTLQTLLKAVSRISAAHSYVEGL